MAPISAPAAKAFSLPVITIAPMPSSASSASNAAPSSSINWSFSAFNALGRFSVSHPTRPRVSTSTNDSLIDCLLSEYEM
ncbi:Uncharacterised protein [Bordetella pertussis]|nr:Uncharacterised protein [Bordetella pertussis]CFO03266.1 Uncharacterised protein [Bordetella pertussis]CFP66598.1 Uncharacterised protein [Bordetella pertussis]CFU00183.1 Uncharacterised protein [Bordetella pertussis]CPN18824.1 Uncharacterised protein [Bordetella pertussis]